MHRLMMKNITTKNKLSEQSGLRLKKIFFPLLLLLSSLIISQPVFSQVVLEDQLIAHWPLLEGSGATASDTTGNGHSGTLNNSPDWNINGLGFDGQNDYVDVGTLDASSQELTLAAWVQSDQLDNCTYRDCRIISKATGTAEQSHYWMLSTIRVGNQTRLRFRLKTNDITTTLIASAGNLTNGEMFHATAVYDGNTMRLYKDGVEVGNLIKTGIINTDNTVQTWIGGNPNNASIRPWKGTIADVRVYQQALSATEINAVIAEQDDGSTPPDDTTPPSISNLQTTVTDSQATISWTTNEAAKSEVSYGLSTNLEIDTVVNNDFTTVHSVTLSGLIADKTYRYQLQVTDDSDNNALSNSLTFTTDTLGTGTGGDDLFAHWPLNEGAGIVANDITNNGHYGVLTNAPQWTNNQLDFDGNNDYVDLGALDVSGQAFSITASVQSNQLDNCSFGDCRIISKATGTAEQAHYWMLSTIKVGNQTRLRFRLKTNGITSTLIASSGDISNGEQFHVVASYDGSTMRLYKNGVSVGSKAKTGNIDTSNTVKAWIGSNPNDANSRPWKGIIANVRIYQQVLSNEEINTIKNQDQIDDTIPPDDNTAPIISNISTVVTETTATISWETNEVSDSSVAYGSDNSYGNTKTGNANTTTHEVTLTGLTAGTSYHFAVSSSDSQGNSASSTDQVVTTEAISPPDDPVAPVISNIHISVTDTSATINWLTDKPADSEVMYGEIGTSPISVNDSADKTTHSATLTGLVANTEYYFSVSSTDANGLFDSSEESHFTTNETGQVDSALFAHWPLNEGNGLTAIDITNHGHDGTLINNPSWMTDGLHFDGNNDYIDLGTLNVTGSAITITSWVVSDQLTNCSYSDCRIISKTTGTAEQSHYWMLSTIKVGNQTRLRFRIKTNGITTTLIAGSGNLSDGEIFHVAAVYDGNTMYLYKNGVEVGSKAKTGSIDTNNSVKAWIGSNPNSATSRPWKGTLSDVRIYQQALTGNNIVDVMDGYEVEDTTAPVISNVQAVVTNDTAIISWDTDEPATSNVAYGLDDSYSATPETDGTFDTQHSVIITGLTEQTDYHFQISSADASGNVSSEADDVFTTEATPDTTAPVISNIQTEVSDSTATISWDTDEPATSNVAYGLDDSYSATPETGGTLVTQHSVTITGLAEQTDYHFQISSTDASGNVSSEVDDVFTTEATPDTTAPVISNIQTVVSDSTVTISWDTDELATSHVAYGLDDTYSATPETDGTFDTQHSVTITGLTEQTDYHFQISSTDASGNTSSEADDVFTTEATPDTTAPVISNIQTVVSDSTVTISWDTDEPATSNIAYGLDDSYSATPETDGTSDTQHSVTLTGLTELTEYHFQISSADASGNVSSEADDVFTTEATPDTTAPVISNIQTEVSDSTATISWDTDEPATSNVAYGLDDSYTATPETDGALVTQHSVTITGLTEQTEYHFQISSTDASGNVSSEADDVFTTEATPDTTTPVISNIQKVVSDSTVTISWDTDEPATSNIAYGLDDTYNATPETDGTFVTQHSVTITGLTDLTDYHFQISSADASGNSDSSTDQTFTTEAFQFSCVTPWGEEMAHDVNVSAYQQATVAFGSVCEEETLFCDNGTLFGTLFGTYTFQQCQIQALQPPQNLIATANNGAIELSWSSVTNASSYNLYYSEEAAFPAAQTTQINNVQSPYSLTGLSNDVTYYLAVTVVIGADESSFSNEVSATPKAKGKLNDTGITWGGNYPSGNNNDCSGVETSAQDCSHGRDAQAAAETLVKIGAGSAGFDFTKLDASGGSLAADASSWSCVKDNHTGLIWEAKTDNGDIHDKDNRYKWGGETALGDGTVGEYYDDWNPLVSGSNTEALCGFSDWRVPSSDELTTLLDLSRVNMAIDMDYFPNTASNVWSSSPNANFSSDAWYVHFNYGHSSLNNRYNDRQVRLVRSGQ